MPLNGVSQLVSMIILHFDIPDKEADLIVLKILKSQLFDQKPQPIISKSVQATDIGFRELDNGQFISLEELESKLQRQSEPQPDEERLVHIGKITKSRKDLFPHGHKDCLECETFIKTQQLVADQRHEREVVEEIIKELRDMSFRHRQIGRQRIDNFIKFLKSKYLPSDKG